MHVLKKSCLIIYHAAVCTEFQHNQYNREYMACFRSLIMRVSQASNLRGMPGELPISGDGPEPLSLSLSMSTNSNTLKITFIGTKPSYFPKYIF